MSFFQNCTNFEITGGEFNEIQGNLNHFTSNTISATTGSHNSGAGGGANNGQHNSEFRPASSNAGNWQYHTPEPQRPVAYASQPYTHVPSPDSSASHSTWSAQQQPQPTHPSYSYYGPPNPNSSSSYSTWPVQQDQPQPAPSYGPPNHPNSSSSYSTQQEQAVTPPSMPGHEPTHDWRFQSGHTDSSHVNSRTTTSAALNVPSGFVPLVVQAMQQSFQPAVVTVYDSLMDDIPPIRDSPRSSISSGTGSEGGRRRRQRSRSRSGSGSDWSQFSDGSTGSQFSERPMVIPLPAMFPSIPPPSLSEIKLIPIPASPPIVIQPPPLAPGSGPPLMTTAPTPSLPEEQRPLSAKIRKAFSAALNLRQRVSEDESTLLDSMSPVHAIVYNHDRRAALLTQSLSASQRRKALQSCYQRICTSLLTVLDSRDAQQAVLLLEGDRAQSFLDAVQNVLDKGSLPSARHTSKARRLILRLSEARDKLPSSLFIAGVVDLDKHPTFAGGFGDIYRASHNGATVAVKRIRMFSGADSDSQRSRLQFCREALVWQRLHHKYVLRLIGIDRESFPSSFCMVSPWMKHGHVLKYLAEHGRDDVDKLLLQVAKGLAYLHSMNIVHGDLRGTNILVSDACNACLADFGLTTVVDTTSTTNAALTSTANHAGSARWFAPELIQPTSFGCEKFMRTTASDVYAFACVCLELHTGSPPFTGVSPDVAAMLKVIAGERPARPYPSMSDGLWNLITAAWAQNFRDRPNIQTIIEHMRTLNV